MSAAFSSPTKETLFLDGDTDEFSCDGGGGALGHPVVWYSFENQHQMMCMYCGRKFAKKTDSSPQKAGH